MDKETIKKQVVSGMIWRFGERIIAQGVSFVLSVILARLLMPDDYGVVAIVGVFISLANVFLSSGLSTSLIQKKDADETDFSSVFWSNLILSIILYLILFCIAPIIASVYHNEILKPVLRVFALTLPISSVHSIQTAVLQKRMQFKTFFFATIIGTVISAVVGIYMAYHGYGVWALVYQNLTNTIIDTIILTITVKWIPKRIISKNALIPLLRFGIKVTLTDTIGTVFNNLVSFLMGIRYSSSDLAFYSKGIHLPRLFRDNIFSTIVTVIFPAMSNVSDKQEHVKLMCRKAIGVTSYLVFPMMFGIVAINKTLVSVLYTDKWLGMTPYIVISCIEAVISVIPTICWQGIKALGRSDALLRNEFITKPFYLILVVGGMLISSLAMAIGMLIASLIYVIASIVYTQKILDYSFVELIMDVRNTILLSLIMCITVKLLGYLSLPIIVTLILQIICGIIVYLSLSIISKDKNYSVLYKLVISKLHHNTKNGESIS